MKKSTIVFAIPFILIIAICIYFFSPKAETFTLNEGEFVIKENIGELVFDTTSRTQDCLSRTLISDCVTYLAVYEKGEDQFKVWVEFPTKANPQISSIQAIPITYEEFSTAAKDRYEESTEKTRKGYPYLSYVDGNTLRLMWLHSDNVIMRITSNDYSDKNKGLAEDLMDAYMPLYPSE